MKLPSVKHPHLRIAWSVGWGIAALLLIVAFLLFRPSAQQPANFPKMPAMYVYHYENSDGTFTETEIPAKGRTFEMVQVQWEFFKAQSNLPNDQLYLTDHREPEDDPTDPRWKLPYKAPAHRK